MAAFQTVLQSVLGTDNGSTLSNSTTTSAFAPLLAALPGSMRHLAASPMLMSGSSGLGDGLLFFVMGSMFETVRFLFSSGFSALQQAILAGWYSLVKAFIFQVRVEKDDEAFDWLMNFFGKEPAFRKATSVCLSTKITHKQHNFYSENCGCEDCQAKKGEKPTKDLLSRLSYVPAIGGEGGFAFFYGYSRIRVTRGDHWHDGLNIQILTFGMLSGRSVMTKLITNAKALQESQTSKRISVYLGQPHGSWTRAESKARRAWSSVILESGVKERLLDDANEFLRSQKYYAERGIPYRRGYLLHGVPGSGKTSLVQALAGTLDLDIYVIPLANRGFDDGSLGGLIAGLPASCIALIEDIDCAFNDQARKRALQVKKSSKDEGKEKEKEKTPQDVLQSGVTLSGLLNAIDGVAAHEGRLLFATTNVPSTLDPALIRPGRIDLSIEFKNASQLQAQELFRCFFPPARAYQDETHDKEDTQLGKRSPLSTILPDDLLTPPGTPNSEKADSSQSVEDEEHRHLKVDDRDRLAKEFAQGIPEREFSMASLQGYLLMHKETPHRCAREVSAWVEEQRVALAEAKAKEEEAEAEKEESNEEDTDEAESSNAPAARRARKDHSGELDKIRAALEDLQKFLSTPGPGTSAAIDALRSATRIA